MSREIKYKALVVKTHLDNLGPNMQWAGVSEYEEMVSVQTISFNENKIDFVTDNEGDEYSYFDKSLKAVIQYTGLKDKNGVEIYEGDILSLRNKENKPYLMKVLWTGQGYGYEIIRNDTKHSGYIVGHLSERGLNFYNQTSEIIGNIYQNPELLERGE